MNNACVSAVNLLLQPPSPSNTLDNDTDRAISNAEIDPVAMYRSWNDASELCELSEWASASE
jgi:hypothetical protein